MTKIEWTDETWNPVTGCTKISEGCKNCYAECMATRLAGRFGYPPAPHHFDITLHPERLDTPRRWRKQRRVFVCSMSDLFHENVPFSFINRILARIVLSPQHIFQILTKRTKRMLEYFIDYPARDNIEYELGTGLSWEAADFFGTPPPIPYNEICGVSPLLASSSPEIFDGAEKIKFEWPLPNVWLGTSVENQRRANERIPHLLRVPAAVRFLSMEPLLGPIDFDDIFPGGLPSPQDGPWTNAIHWLIVGGESGPGARPMHPDWVRSLRDQAQAAGVPFFFKQWGAWFPRDHWEDNPDLILPDDDVYEYDARTVVLEDHTVMHRVGKHAAGRTLDGRIWNEYPVTEPAE